LDALNLDPLPCAVESSVVALTDDMQLPLAPTALP
jgi:hypothetical protein